MKGRIWAAVAVSGLLCITSALADDGRNGGFQSSAIGSTPGMTIGGVPSGGAPWMVKAGQATVSANGRIEVDVVGLLLLNGTTGPVTMVAASLVCGGSGGAVVASTGGVSLSTTGNARIEETVTLPATCGAPVVLVRIDNTGTPGAFIALTGFNTGAGANAESDR